MLAFRASKMQDKLKISNFLYSKFYLRTMIFYFPAHLWRKNLFLFHKATRDEVKVVTTPAFVEEKTTNKDKVQPTGKEEMVSLSVISAV